MTSPQPNQTEGQFKAPNGSTASESQPNQQQQTSSGWFGGWFGRGKSSSVTATTTTTESNSTEAATAKATTVVDVKKDEGDVSKEGEGSSSAVKVNEGGEK